MKSAEIDHLFTYHAPKGNQRERYEKIRAAGKSLAHVINTCCYDSPEMRQAIMLVQLATMAANMAIATSETERPDQYKIRAVVDMVGHPQSSEELQKQYSGNKDI